MYYYYHVDKDALADLIGEEISHIADRAYDANGLSLYDAVVVTEKDKPTIERGIDDAVSALSARLYDICTKTEDGNGPVLEFFVPDYDHSFEDMTEQEITRFLTLFVVAMRIQSLGVQGLQEYAERSQASMQKVVTFLKSRKLPEQW